MLLAGIASQAMGAKRVSVAEFEKALASADGQSDGKAAKQIADFELTERASTVRVARWESEFPGRHCHEAFTVLADSSAFLDLPTAEIPGNATPDIATQRAMLQKTAEYASTTLSRLPNFFATRKTEHFEDTPSSQTLEHFNGFSTGHGPRSAVAPGPSTGESTYQPVHSTGRSSISVSYRDGHEFRGQKQADIDLEGRATKELTTHGEFGPILAVVLQDTSGSAITWGHWEQGENGVNAVYRFSVPQGKSDYMVALPRGMLIDRIFPAYHGEIAIDPANGDILRITVIADLAPPNEVVRSSILVEYGPVQIGGTPYICPLKSVALAKLPFGDQQGMDTVLKTELNDVVFTDYHVFRAEARIVPVAGAGDEPQQAPPK